MSKKIRTTIYLSEQEIRALEDYKKVLGLNQSEIIRHSINSFVGTSTYSSLKNIYLKNQYIKHDL